MARRGWADETMEKNEKMKRLIRSGMINSDVKRQDFLKAAGISESKYYYHLRSPDKITLGELRLFLKMKILSDDEILKIL